jgi:hypothetical protein
MKWSKIPCLVSLSPESTVGFVICEETSSSSYHHGSGKLLHSSLGPVRLWTACLLIVLPCFDSSLRGLSPVARVLGELFTALYESRAYSSRTLISSDRCGSTHVFRATSRWALGQTLQSCVNTLLALERGCGELRDSGHEGTLAGHSASFEHAQLFDMEVHQVQLFAHPRQAILPGAKECDPYEMNSVQCLLVSHHELPKRFQRAGHVLKTENLQRTRSRDVGNLVIDSK